MSANDGYRNVAIIAHVDHGKTTLVDAMLSQSGRFDDVRGDVAERVMDSNDLERERGITILGKATSIRWRGKKINIADTPGHADFGGEVERMLKVVDGVCLLVDASEGPLPQTRFVLSKALEAGLSPILVVNKIDRPDARPAEVLDEVYDLFIELGADDDQIEFPVFYTNAKAGTASADPNTQGPDLAPLLDCIVDHIPAPSGDSDAPLQALVTNLDYNEYIGRLGTGRVFNGTLREGDFVAIVGEEGTRKVRLGQLYVFEGLERSRVGEAPAGELFAVAGIEEIGIGDTIANVENPEPLPRVTVDEPTIAMFFMANNGPFSGLEGKYVTSRNIRERLDKELMGNVSIRVEDTEAADKFKVVGRGELALSVLIENMRREGYEMTVSKPEVVTQTDENGKLLEPLERVVIDIPGEFLGVVTEKLALRKGRMDDLRQLGGDRQRAEFLVPSRGLIGYRSDFMNDTRGTGVMNTLFEGWTHWTGDISYRKNGALVSDRRGKTTTYALFNLQPRGILFLGPQDEVYDGQIVGEHAKQQDLDVNVVREKQLTNFRTVNKDAAQILSPPRQMTLEEALQWIADDELVEVTPSRIRVRKKELDPAKRKQASRAAKRAQEA